MRRKSEIYWPWQMGEKVEKVVVVADVYAATSNLVAMLSRNVKRIVLANRNNVFQLKERYPKAWLVGDDETAGGMGVKLDVVNYPSQVVQAKLEGREIIYMTNNGTRMVEQAFERGAEQVVGVGFVNITAVANWLKQNEGSVGLLAAGERYVGNRQAPEDWECVVALGKIMVGQEVDWKRDLEKVRRQMIEFYRGDISKEDLKLILQVDIYNSVTTFRRVRDTYEAVGIESMVDDTIPE